MSQKIRIEVYVCEECLETLQTAGVMPHDMWLNSCLNHVARKASLVRNPTEYQNPIVRYLEGEGYIISTEKEREWIIIKPLGHYVIDYDMHAFCVKPKEHGHIYVK